MRLAICLTIMVLSWGLGGCSRDASGEKASPAREVGKAAYKIEKESEKAAKKAGEELKKATHDARQGWKEAQKEDAAKHPKK